MRGMPLGQSALRRRVWSFLKRVETLGDSTDRRMREPDGLLPLQLKWQGQTQLFLLLLARVNPAAAAVDK